MKAQVATIDLGFTQFDGLMLPDGQYAIAQMVNTRSQFHKQQTFSRDPDR